MRDTPGSTGGDAHVVLEPARHFTVNGAPLCVVRAGVPGLDVPASACPTVAGIPAVQSDSFGALWLTGSYLDLRGHHGFVGGVGGGAGIRFADHRIGVGLEYNLALGPFAVPHGAGIGALGDFAAVVGYHWPGRWALSGGAFFAGAFLFGNNDVTTIVTANGFIGLLARVEYRVPLCASGIARWTFGSEVRGGIVPGAALYPEAMFQVMLTTGPGWG